MSSFKFSYLKLDLLCHSASAFAFFLSGSNVFADQEITAQASNASNNERFEERLSISKTDCFGSITPTAQGCPGSSRPYAIGSFIYWKSQLEKEDIAEKVINRGLDDFILIEQKELDFKYSPGLKLGIGYNFKRDYWDVFLNWTLLNSNKSRKALFSSTHIIQAPNSTVIHFPFPATAGNALIGGTVHSDWDLHFTTLDFELGRNFFISRNVGLRPFIGLKANWIKWKFKSKYEDFASAFTPTVMLDPFKGILKEDNHGVGPRMGINSRWILSSLNFAIIGNCAVSLLYSDLKANKTLDVTPLIPSGFETVAHRHELKPVLECFLGVDWNHCIRNSCNIFLSAGYEAQLWWDQSSGDFYTSFFNFNSELHAVQALMLQGLTASMGLNF